MQFPLESVGLASLIWAVSALFASWLFSSWPHDVACARGCGSGRAAGEAAPRLLPAEVSCLCFRTGLYLSAFVLGN